MYTTIMPDCMASMHRHAVMPLTLIKHAGTPVKALWERRRPRRVASPDQLAGKGPAGQKTLSSVVPAC